MCLFLSFPLFSLLFLSLQAGWKKRLTIKLSKHHLLLTPSSPLNSSLLLCLPFLLPSIDPSSPVSLLTLYEKTVYFCSPIQPSSPPKEKKQTKKIGKTSRGPTTVEERMGEGWVCKSSLSSLSPRPLFFYPKSIQHWSASNTVVPIRITAFHSSYVYSNYNYKNKDGNLTVPLRSLFPSRTTTWQLPSNC